ncbi:hypothetical protein BC827DRAFT_616359 [Russula dissimulans]|nr:hypothetical protein BC827DRAFT_616359 [Russula dissimulans]
MEDTTSTGPLPLLNPFHNLKHIRHSLVNVCAGPSQVLISSFCGVENRQHSRNNSQAVRPFDFHKIESIVLAVLFDVACWYRHCDSPTHTLTWCHQYLPAMSPPICTRGDCVDWPDSSVLLPVRLIHASLNQAWAELKHEHSIPACDGFPTPESRGNRL